MQLDSAGCTPRLGRNRSREKFESESPRSELVRDATDVTTLRAERWQPAWYRRAMRPFVIDTDAGSDDAVALVMALTDPQIQVEALTVVAGNVPLDQAVQNALFVVEACGRDVPVFGGAAQPLVQALATAQSVHGQDGMGDIGLNLKGREPARGAAHVELCRLAESHSGQLTLVTLGPLTNVALALEHDAQFAHHVKRCVVMGGTGRGPGNISPVAEFNVWVDPEAAQLVFKSDLKIEMVGWDISMEFARFTRDEALELRAIGSPLAELCIDIQGDMNKLHKLAPELHGFDIPDAIAMAIASDPGVATRSERLNVEVAVGDVLTRGQTVVDGYRVSGREPNVTVVCEASREEFLRHVRRALESAR